MGAIRLRNRPIPPKIFRRRKELLIKFREKLGRYCFFTAALNILERRLGFEPRLTVFKTGFFRSIRYPSLLNLEGPGGLEPPWTALEAVAFRYLPQTLNGSSFLSVLPLHSTAIAVSSLSMSGSRKPTQTWPFLSSLSPQ